MTLPGCTDPCPLDTFVSLTNKVALSEAAWTEGCGLAAPPANANAWPSSAKATAGVVGALCVLLCVVLLVLLVRGRRSPATAQERMPLQPGQDSRPHTPDSGSAPGVPYESPPSLGV